MTSRRLNKIARSQAHTQMMLEFHEFLVRRYGDHRPGPGDGDYNKLLEAFKAGWEAA